ncbi:MAG: hypothetical protein OXC13_15865 [Caldilineaceae bacterium]|nr:hypothetical protein [Caldilineaceae bacterium]
MSRATMLSPRAFAARTRAAVLAGASDPRVHFQYAGEVGQPASVGVKLAIALGEPITDPTFTGGPYYVTRIGIQAACAALGATSGELNALLWICGAPASPLGRRSRPWPYPCRRLVWDRLAMLEVMPAFNGLPRRVGVLTDALRSVNAAHWHAAYGFDARAMHTHHKRTAFWIDLTTRIAPPAAP